MIAATRRFQRPSIPALLEAAVARTPDRVAIRWIDPARPDGPPTQYTYRDFDAHIRRAAACLREHGVGAGDRVLVLAENSPEYQMFFHAAQALRAETAALFANLDAAPASDIFRRVRPKVAFVSTSEQWHKIEGEARAAGALKLVVMPGEALPVEKVPVLPWREVAAHEPMAPAEFARLVAAIQPDDPYILIFTSGTTGRQKGVRISQHAMSSTFEGGVECTAIVPQDEILSFLPFAHIAGQCAFLAAIGSGAGAIMCGRRDDIPRALTLSPTFILSVPLIYERVWTGVLAQVRSKPRPLAALLLRGISAASKIALGKPVGIVDRALAGLANALVGSKLKAKLGGRIRILYAGGAPSNPEMIAFFRGFGIPYVEVFGMSETAGLISSNRVDDPNLRIGSVGKPWRTVEARIEPDGELVVRGETLMTGYLEKEDEEGACTPDGFFRTGDLARFDEAGYLYITGRKKHLFVLSTGKKLSPEQVEQRMAAAPGVAGAVLVGDGEAFLAGGLFVTKEDLERLRAEAAASAQSVEDVLMQRVRAQCAGLSDYETPKKVFVIEGTPQDHLDVLTPTLKVKREVFARKFAREIGAIFGRAEAPVPQLK